MENVENIFEGAKFGDKFLTRDGRVAIFHKGVIIDNILWTVDLITHNKSIICGADGFACNREDDIISKYQEPHGECNNNPDGCLSSICPQTCGKFMAHSTGKTTTLNINTVSKCQEPINEDNLNILAEKSWEITRSVLTQSTADYWNNYNTGFKAGYRNAKECNGTNHLNLFKGLPHLSADKNIIDDWGYTPSLYHFDTKWHVSWVHCEDGDVLIDYDGETPEEAILNAYMNYRKANKE